MRRLSGFLLLVPFLFLQDAQRETEKEVRAFLESYLDTLESRDEEQVRELYVDGGRRLRGDVFDFFE